jgi:hypothetical protein
MIRRCAVVLCGVLVLAAAGTACRGAAHVTELQRVRSGALDVVLLSPHEALRHGKDDFIIEFKNVSDGKLVNAGNVRVTASMPMPGMPMFGSIDVQRTGLVGRYRADGEFPMAGTWRMAVEWDGPIGKGSVTFSGSVQ